jgi:hypothetical protein
MVGLFDMQEMPPEPARQRSFDCKGRSISLIDNKICRVPMAITELNTDALNIQRPRVLVLEDEVLISIMVVDILDGLGCERRADFKL